MRNATWNIVTKAFPSFSLKLFERNSLMHIWGEVAKPANMFQNAAEKTQEREREREREGGS